jgi:predicted nucleic acid-binding protein
VARLTVLDASILLAHLDDTDPHTDAAEAILAQAEELAASTITLGEVLVGAARVGRLDEQLEALSVLKITEVPVERGAAARLARLRAETGLRMPDCCVLHAAVAGGADALATRDEKLSREAAARGLETVIRSRNGPKRDTCRFARRPSTGLPEAPGARLSYMARNGGGASDHCHRGR